MDRYTSPRRPLLIPHIYPYPFPYPNPYLSLGDGIHFQIGGLISPTPLKACFSLKGIHPPDDGFTYTYLDIVRSNSAFTKFTPLGLEVPYDSAHMYACFDVNSLEATYFPALYLSPFHPILSFSPHTNFSFQGYKELEESHVLRHVDLR